MVSDERKLEEDLLEKLRGLKYEHRTDIRDRSTLEWNFRDKFQALNHVKLTDGEFQRLLDEVVTPDVFTAAHTLRNRNSFSREDGTPLNYTLVNIDDWCKNSFEVVSQLRINTDNSHHRYDVLLLINGVPVVQIELKTLGINPRRAIEQIVEYKNDPGNGYTRTLLCFVQLFVVSNRDSTYYFANNNARQFTFNADERFLPIYQYAAPDNSKITGLDPFADALLAKCTLGQMISRYMVLVASEQKLLMMRPYQIYAVKAIVECIQQNCGNGYVWHTTGSGKTLWHVAFGRAGVPVHRSPEFEGSGSNDGLLQLTGILADPALDLPTPALVVLSFRDGAYRLDGLYDSTWTDATKGWSSTQTEAVLHAICDERNDQNNSEAWKYSLPERNADRST